MTEKSASPRTDALFNSQADRVLNSADCWNEMYEHAKSIESALAAVPEVLLYQQALGKINELQDELATIEALTLERVSKYLKEQAEPGDEDGYTESDTNAFIWTNKEAEWVSIELEEQADAILALSPGPAAAELAELRKDAERYRWLTDDHDYPHGRIKCREILDRMAGMSYSAASAAIDAARSGRGEGK